MSYSCPGCGGVYDRPSSTASHAYQIDDSQHPWNSYDEALRAVADEAKSDDPPSAESDDPTGDPPDSRDPSMATPPLRDRPDHPCPECGEPTRRLSEGRMVSVELDGGTKWGRVDAGDRGCTECDLVITADGENYKINEW